MALNAYSYDYDVAVVGGGHAGCEAALAVSRMGLRCVLLTHLADAIARMPCNPSIGGIAKSHLVYELDALGGEMARNADFTGIQFRTLNASRGPAVQSTRVQCDKAAYAGRMRRVIGSTAGLTVVEDEVIGLMVVGKCAQGVITSGSGRIAAKAVILTTGTSLGGRIHVGRNCVPGGGDGRPPSELLAEQLRRHGFGLTRFKTGTPPRLDARTINWARTTPQPGDNPQPLMSWEAKRVVRNRELFHVEQSGGNGPADRLFHVEHAQLDSVIDAQRQSPCWLTSTTEVTHRIIRDNLDKSALYGGWIVGTGVRYCPSIEDKVVKFPDKQSHHVFLEPEALNTTWIYPNGISNSLELEVQVAMVRSIPGLETAEFLAPAYAIEYDCVDTAELLPTLESKVMDRLYFAGQVNRTTGYEEAAAQGFVAGVNAAMAIRGEAPFIPSRHESYIGVMVDDLVTKGTDEPYRMFTSRAERRLILRQDNARFRMLEHALRIGIVDRRFTDETVAFEKMISDHVDSPSIAMPDEVAEQIAVRDKYRGYIEQEEKAARRSLENDGVPIPAWVDYWLVSGLRHEARERFSRARPATLGQAARLRGITPADIFALTIALKRGKL
jgi:tRNA uridine 5-carboxymethylaminomethyl modification enzyme